MPFMTERAINFAKMTFVGIHAVRTFSFFLKLFDGTVTFEANVILNVGSGSGRFRVVACDAAALMSIG